MGEQPDGLVTRTLDAGQLASLWSIERRELVDEVYRVEAGQLRLERRHYDTRGWPEGEPESQAPLLRACLERGGVCRGVFAATRLVAASVLDGAPVGDYPQLRQLSFLHVGHDWRGRGLASMLYRRCLADARALGAAGLYISATSTRRTVDFYLGRGARLASHPDRVLFSLEPDDIHLLHQP